MNKDYYKILGVGKSADAATIKKAYRKLAKKYHPDSNEGNARAAAMFKDVNEAYNVLSDEKKRKMYDQYGDPDFDESRAGFQGNPFGTGGQEFHQYHFNGGDDMDDILKNFFGGGASGFNQQYSRRSNYPTKGSDIESTVEVGFDEAAFGSKRRIHLQSQSGKDQTLEITIPAGIANEKTIRLKGKGNPGRNGGAPGDLLLKVIVHDKPGYKREGQDVYTTVKVPFTTAVLGGEAKISTLYGDVMCKVRPGTQSGSQIRLKNKGIVSMKDKNVHGDQYVKIEIDVPRELSNEAKEKLKEFARLCGETANHKAGVA